MKKLSPQQKAANTRATEKAAWDYYRKTEVPALRRIDQLINRLLRKETISVRWLGERRLRHGAQYGRLLRVSNGGKTWTVMIEGYRGAQQFHPVFWEVLGLK